MTASWLDRLARHIARLGPPPASTFRRPVARRPLRHWLALHLLALCGAANAGMYFAEVPGHPELVILTAPNIPASGTIWMRCAIGQTWDPNAAGPRGGTAKGTCTGTATAMTWNATTNAVSQANANGGFGGYTGWVVPSGENISSLFPPETPKDAPETWPCAKQLQPTDPCWGDAITDNDLFRNTPTDNQFWSSTNLVITRLVANFATGKTDNRAFSSGTGYLRLMRPAPGQLHTVTVTTSSGGSVDKATRQQLQTGEVKFALLPSIGYQIKDHQLTSGNCILTARIGDFLRTTVGTNDCTLHVNYERIPGMWIVTNVNERDRPFGWDGKLVCDDALLTTGGSTSCTFTYLNPGYQVTATPGCDTWTPTATGGVCTVSNVTADREVEVQTQPLTTFTGTTVPTPGTDGVADTATATLVGVSSGAGDCRFDPSETRFEAAPPAPAGQWLAQGMFHYKLLDCSAYFDKATVSITWPQPADKLLAWRTDANGNPAFEVPENLTTVDANTQSYYWTDMGMLTTWDDTVGPSSVARYAITATPTPAQAATAGGSVVCTPNPVPHGDDAQCTATPAPGHMFTAWGGDCSGAAPTCTLSQVTASHAVTAQFGAVQTSFSGSTVPSAGTPAGTATATFTGGGPSCRFDAANTAFVAAPPQLPPGQRMPHGMLRFKLIGCNTSPVDMAITWPEAVNGLSKWGKATPSDTAPSHFVPSNAVASGNTTRFTVQDGQLGDDDWTVNGDIVDPVGATTSISIAPVPGLGHAALALLAALAALLGAARAQRRLA